MSDYDYQRVQLSNNDGHQDSRGLASSNNAQGVDGYSLDIETDKSWPGQSTDPNKLILHKDKMQTLADDIDTLVQTLQNDNNLKQLAQVSAVSFGPDSWDAAAYLKSASSSVATTVQQYTSQLITNLQDASRAIRSAMGGYVNAESANRGSAQNQYSSMDSHNSSGAV